MTSVSVSINAKNFNNCNNCSCFTAEEAEAWRKETTYPSKLVTGLRIEPRSPDTQPHHSADSLQRVSKKACSDCKEIKRHVLCQQNELLNMIVMASQGDGWMDVQKKNLDCYFGGTLRTWKSVFQLAFGEHSWGVWGFFF